MKQRVELFQWNDFASQQILIQKKTAETTAYASGAVVSLPASLHKANEEVSKPSKKPNKYRDMWQKADGVHKYWSSSAGKVVEVMRG